MDAARAGGVNVELAGEVSDVGAYGHLGLYERSFLVRAIRR
jgi:hypothetical protein